MEKALTLEERTELVELAWLVGNLEYKLRPEQQLLKDVINRAGRELIVPNIARKIGKTTTCVVYALEQAIQKKQHIRYATAFLTDLQEFLLPIFDLMLADCPEHLKPRYKASTKTFHFHNGSVIKLVGLDKNRNGLRGNIIDILIIDESAFVTNLEYLYKSVIIPATKDRPFKLIFPSTPPETPSHFWARELVPKAKLRGTYIELTLDADQSLSPEERKRLLDEVGGEDSATAQREFFCKIIIDVTRAVAPSFKKDIHVQAFEAEHINWRIFGDQGAKDKNPFLKVGYDHNTRKILVRSEYVPVSGLPTPAIVEGYKAAFPEKYGLILDCPKQLRTDYSALDLPSSHPHKEDFESGLLQLNAALHQNQVIIHPDCKLLVLTLESGLLNPRRTDYDRTKEQSKELGHCDAAACLIYALRGVDKTTDLRPKPDPFEIFTAPAYQHDPTSNLRKLFQ